MTAWTGYSRLHRHAPEAGMYGSSAGLVEGGMRMVTYD